MPAKNPKKNPKKKSVAKPQVPTGDRFRAGLVDALELEILDAAGERVEDVVDGDTVRALLEHSEDLMHHDVVAALAVVANKHVTEALRARTESPWELLDDDLAALVDERLDADVVLSEDAEELIGRMMRQELIQDLFTNVIHSAIVSFNKRVNPLFGGLATAMLEDQIKGFIRLFIPVVLDQATSFVVSDRNQELFSDFARSLVRELLDEPLPNLLTLVSTEEERGNRRLEKALAASPRLRELTRELALAAWDRVWADLRHRKLGEVVRLEDHAGWLAEQLAPGLQRALERPHLRAFLESELGHGETPKPAKKTKNET